MLVLYIDVSNWAGKRETIVKTESISTFNLHYFFSYLLSNQWLYSEALQSALVACEICEEKEKKLKPLEMEHQGCAERPRAFQELATNYMKPAKDVQQKLDDFFC